MINVYGSRPNSEKKVAWKDINFHTQQEYIFSYIGGYFNAITTLKEKLGGTSNLPEATIDFNNCIYIAKLNEIPSRDNAFTWNNRRQGISQVAEKLDRFFDFWPPTNSSILDFF